MARARRAAADPAVEVDPAAGAEPVEVETRAAGDPPESPATATAEDLATLRAELAAEREARAKLEGRLEASVAPVVPEAPKPWTRAELRAALERGELTEDRMFEILEDQAIARAVAKSNADTDAKLAASQNKSRIQADLDRYTELFPGVKQAGHPDRERVEREYAYLTSIGQPKSVATEVAALRAVFGPADKIREKTRGARERHVETGGGSGGEDGAESATWQKGLSPRQVAYYGKKLASGFFTGTEDPQFSREIAVARGESPSKVISKFRRQQPGERRVQ